LSGTPPSADPAGAAPDPEGHAAVTRGRLRIRPTRAGLLAVGLLLGAGIVAVNSGNNLLYLVVAALLAALALSGVLGHRNLRGVGLRLLSPAEAWAGRPLTVDAELRNTRSRLPAFLLAVRSPEGGGVAVETPPGATSRIAVTVTFPARGRQPWPPQEVTSEFPFGLIRRGAVVQPPGGCLVYPRPLPVAWEHVERAEREGELLARRTAGAGGDYRGLREYAPGDSLARVHWTSWLRLRRLHSKDFEAEGAPPVVYAFSGVPGPGTEERLGQLAWLVRTALRRGRSVGLELPGRAIAPAAGAAHRRRLLAALALFGEQA
jgi:uncharacterized protein (DUF58 family)